MPRPEPLKSALHVSFPSQLFDTSYYSVAAAVEPVRKSKNSVSVQQSQNFWWFNAILLVGSLLLVTYYVLQINTVAAMQYEMRQLEGRILTLTDSNGALMAEHVKTENSLDMMEFARRHGMVEASDTSHIFEHNNVALH